MWCLRVNGVEVRCVGDKQAEVIVDIPVPETAAALTAPVTLQPVLRDHFKQTFQEDPVHAKQFGAGRNRPEAPLVLLWRDLAHSRRKP